MTLPNSLTILRIILTPIFVALLVSDSPIYKRISLIVYVIAALTDWYDGWIARKYGYTTRWGKFMDPLADKILSASALFSFVYLELIDAWPVWIIVIRDFIITALRSYAEWIGQPIVTSRTAQAKTLGEYIVIYYILFLYIGKTFQDVYVNYKEYIDTLTQPEVLFGMVLLVALSATGTGILYLFDNRNLLYGLYAKFVKTSQSK